MNKEKLKKIIEKPDNINEFSEKIGINRSYFYQFRKLESDITVSILEKIAEYFNVPVSYFFDEEPQITDEKVKEIIKENEYLKQVNEIREKQVEQMQQTIDLLNKMLDK